MEGLAKYLLDKVPSRTAAMGSDAKDEWKKIAVELGEAAPANLEKTLASNAVSDELLAVVTELVAECIQTSEIEAITRILNDPRNSPFARLFEFATRSATALEVVTTNYDRLLEAHAARVGLPVDTGFFGHTIGRYDEAESQSEMLRSDKTPGAKKGVSYARRPHVRISKPHGSLDWFICNDHLMRSDLPLPSAPHIIVPGGSKYKAGYERPFDDHRNRANTAIDNATALLFVGYGFNDEHLQTHLRPKFPTVPALILGMDLTEAALGYLAMSALAIGIEKKDAGCRVKNSCADVLDLDLDLWDLDTLLKEVLSQ